MKTQRLWITFFAGLVLALLAGCAGTRPEVGTWEGLRAPAAVTNDTWSYKGQPARLVKSAHFHVYTTVSDDTFLENLAQVMEGGLEQYRRLAPGVEVGTEPMDCYVFAKRTQWAEFTKQHTGSDARTYLQINRGGYTIKDRFVSYYIGDVGTYAIAAHEGWHQFVGRYFAGRLPPFLEEGIATMFENIRWSGGLPQWNYSKHLNRAWALRKAIENKELWPLEKLVTLHAGDVIVLSGGKIEAFYAQNWAFARFLWEGEGGKYRPALQSLLNDTAKGTVYDPTGSHRLAGRAWLPSAVRPLLEYYLGTDLKTVDRSYQAYIRRIVYEQINDHWHE